MGAQRTPLAIDLFAGCGGLTAGLKAAGFRVLGAVEIDHLAAETYQHNHPEVHLWKRDIRQLTPEELLRTLRLSSGRLDLLAGCPPCQGFSHLRTLNRSRSVDDERNDLVFDFLRFVRGLKPKFVMMENVPGLARDERLHRLGGELRSLGYHVQWEIQDAADFGVPQRRRRLVLVAGRLSRIELARPCGTRVTVGEALQDLPQAGSSGDPLHDFPERRSQRILELIKRIPKNGGSRADQDFQLECHKRCDGFKDIYGRMSWDDVAPTITTGCFNPSKGRFLHPYEDRAITMREAAILQGFDRGYFFSLARGKTGVAEMIGNALPPPFSKHHALAIRAVIERRRKQLCRRRPARPHRSLRLTLHNEAG